MMAGRVLHAGLQLLDRQLVDRSGRLCGKVDDLELSEPDAEGNIHVVAILCGPGALATRFGCTRLGAWLGRMLEVSADGPGRTGRIPFQRVAGISNHISLSLDNEESPTFAVERWVRDHIIDHIPGSR